MDRKPAYKELLQKVSELENEIAELKQSVADLSASNEFLNNITNALDDPVFVKDEQHRWIMLNDKACHLMGCPREELIGKSDYDLFPKEQADVFWEKDDFVLKSGETHNNVEKITWHGKLHTISTQKSLYIDPLSEEKYIVGTIRDITDEKKLDKALRTSEERYAMATRAASVGVWDWNVRTNQFYLDPNIKGILGYSDTEIPNNLEVWASHVHPDDKQAVMEAFQEHIDGKTPEFVYEHRMRHKDGSVRWILARGTAMLNGRGNPVRVVGTDVDITKRKQAEEELHKAYDELEQRVKERTSKLVQVNEEMKREIDVRKRTESELSIMQSAIESSLNAVGIADLQGKLIYVNDACVKMWGYERKEEILGRSLQEFWEGEGVLKTIELLGTKGGAEGEDIGKRRDGSLFNVQFVASVIKDKAGNPAYMFGSFFDITQRKRSEKALRESEKELKTKATDLEETNTALRVLLRKRDEDKTELEAKVVLNVKELISPFLDKLKKTQLTSRQKTYLDIVESNLNSLVSPFGREFSAKYLKLTPTELQVANFIVQGKTTKQVADILNLSSKTIESHRKSIRKKIGIRNKKVNLRTHLLAYMDKSRLPNQVSSSLVEDA